MVLGLILIRQNLGDIMAFLQRYSEIRTGGITFIGNTLGLSKQSNTNNAGTQGSIGAFISLDNSLQVNNFPNGTTLNYLQNGSSATLDIPAGSTILYAELVWGGLYMSSNNNISNLLDNNITLATPSGTHSIAPDPTTAQNFVIPVQGNTVGFYTRSSNVTSLVQSGMNGIYSTSQVPALIEAIDNRTNDTNHAGWTLAVIFSNPTLPFRDLTLWVGGAVVSPLIGVTNITLTGFRTPQTGTPTGKLFVSGQEGDAVLVGDQMFFGEGPETLVNLSGPNNPANNFFCSQINDENGILDTIGTFGNRNANAFAGTNTTACRQGYDITAIDLTNILTSGQTDAYVRFTTAGDLYVPNCLALQIENGVNPDLTITKSVDKEVVISGETINYTSIVTNSGDIPLTNTIFKDNIPTGSTFVPGSVYIDGVNQPSYNPETGFSLGTIIPGDSITVTFQVTAN